MHQEPDTTDETNEYLQQRCQRETTLQLKGNTKIMASRDNLATERKHQNEINIRIKVVVVVSLQPAG